MPKVFDYINSISYKNDIDINDKISEKDYDPFLTNRWCSLSADTILIGNEMNQRHHLNKKMQYDFLKSLVRKRFRKVKWPKKENIENIKVIIEYFKCNYNKAIEYSRIINNEQIEKLQHVLEKGGTNQSVL